MKLLYSQYSSPIPLEEGCICSIVIENQSEFRMLIKDIQRQLNDEPGNCVLSCGGKPISMSKYAEMFCQIVPFPCNRKTLLSRAISSIEHRAAETEYFERSRWVFAEVELLLQELCEDYPLTFEGDKLTISSLLKQVNLSVEETAENDLDAILSYMDMVAEFEREKLFIFVNMRSYFSDEELAEFFYTTHLRKHRVLMIEGSEHPLLPEEKRIIIDGDLCEI